MKGIKALAGLAAAAIALTGAAPVLATTPAPAPTPRTFSYGVNPNVDQSLFTEEAHWELLRTVRNVGVSVHVNDVRECADGSASGLYFTARRELHVCQDNRTPGSPEQVAWTANDLNTIRHEVHHMVQDLQDGRLGDQQLHLVFDNDAQRAALVNAALPPFVQQYIDRSYRSRGGNDFVVQMELEAFSVAELIHPAQLQEALINLSR